MRPGLRVIAEFFEALASQQGPDGLYRGQPDASWRLVPSVFRDGAVGIADRTALYGWMRAAARFANPIPRSDLEWLVLAQHYGLSTALLDWSTSPLVALFFAAEGRPEVDGSVWTASPFEFQEVYYPETCDAFRDRREKPLLVRATAMNARSTAQDSVMSLHTLEDHALIDRIAKCIFTIPKNQKAHTVEALNVLGFTKERLFFDLRMAVDEFQRRLFLADALTDYIKKG